MDINKLIEIQLSQNDIEVHAKNVAALMEYTLESDQHMDYVIHSMINKAYQSIMPIGGFIINQIEHIDIKSGSIKVNNILFNVGKIIASQLKHAEYAAVFYATIGNYVEKESKKMIETGDLLEGYTLDLIGSEAAEFMASSIHQTIKLEANKNNLNITNRFSPGYCNWDVNEQHNLFSLFNNNQIPVTLNNSALMNPIKSVSGLVGIGKEVIFKPYSCAKCSDKKCIYRNKKSEKN
ncbi:MAG: hypothetical protein JW717_14540 [Marinilabiliaceae bacterium]|nr:hypothetical protein [Marinilabiliaceae bacterium]